MDELEDEDDEDEVAKEEDEVSLVIEQNRYVNFEPNFRTLRRERKLY